MLNPDGVYRGYYRLDTFAQNLNRFYIDPSPTKQPTIWAVKKAITQQYHYKKLQIYVDLHAHASKRGCFMFGNNLTGESMLKAMLLPKVMSMNSLNFDFVECSFSDKLMGCKDKKDGLSREGCGRVSIMKACDGLPNCYTLECNYASGRTINHLAPKLVLETG
jgi:cytosolic carboxypeptidase protein 5